MNLLEKQIIVVRKLRESMPLQDKAYFYLSPMLNTKVHKKTEKLQGAGRVTEKGS